MVCKHKRIKSVNCMLFCIDCGERLPDDYLTAKKAANSAPEAKPAEEPAPAEKPAKTAKNTGRKKGTK